MVGVDGLRVVATGVAADDLVWSVLAGNGDASDFYSFVERRRGSAKATSGMGGPKLHPGQLVNTWWGQATGLPPFVLVRTAPQVRRVVVVLASGSRVVLPLSAVISEFGLRFGAAPLPEGDAWADVEIESDREA
jgi:hypothetical protein